MRVKKVDFTGVDTFTRCEEGQHVAKLSKLEDKQSQSGDDMLVGVFEVILGESKGSRVYENFHLTQKALWKLKSFLEAVGVKAEGKVKIDLDKLVGRQCIIEVGHEEYNGVTRAKIGAFLPLKKDEPFDEDDGIDEVNLEDMDLKELLAYAKKNKVTIPKKDREDAKKVRKVLEQWLAEQDEDDDDDWEYDE
jgi:hypothetical protein